MNGTEIRRWMYVQKELLKVKDLKQYFPIKGGLLGRTINHVKAVDGISFTVYEGETLSIVGESGCGKSTTGRAILRHNGPTIGETEFYTENLLSLKKGQMRNNRKDAKGISQDPYGPLNPRQTTPQTPSDAMEIQNPVPKKARSKRI